MKLSLRRLKRTYILSLLTPRLSPAGAFPTFSQNNVTTLSASASGTTRMRVMIPLNTISKSVTPYNRNAAATSHVKECLDVNLVYTTSIAYWKHHTLPQLDFSMNVLMCVLICQPWLCTTVQCSVNSNLYYEVYTVQCGFFLSFCFLISVLQKYYLGTENQSTRTSQQGHPK